MKWKNTIFGHRMRERRKSRKKEQNRGEIKKTESFWVEDNTIIEEKDKKVDCYEKMDR